ASSPAIPSKSAGDLFRPDPALPHIDGLITFVKAKIAIDWIGREKPKPKPKVNTGDLLTAESVIRKHEAEAFALEATDDVRKTVVDNGICSKAGACVLPLGRFEWEKPLAYVKDGESSKTAVLAVVVAADLPVGEVRGVQVRGEFCDLDGKKVVEVSQKSLIG